MHILVIQGEPKKFKGHRLRLWRWGFRKEEKGKYICATSSKWKINKVKEYCKSNKLRFRIDNSYGKRSGDYRKKFFDKFPPNASKNKWYCSYCGKKLKSFKLEVDHLYPVYHASTSLKIQARMNREGIAGVNDIENLVPSCSKCNGKKGASMGLWIIRGKIGRHALTWRLVTAFKSMVFLYLLVRSIESGLFFDILDFLISVIELFLEMLNKRQDGI